MTSPPRSADDYECLTVLGGDRARVRFEGPFQGRNVIWDATLLTLQRFYNEQVKTPGAAPLELQQFIEIPPQAPTLEEIPITVALDVPLIDHATVLKTIIMIRKYKRLAPGRHAYGRPRRFSAT